MEFTNGLVAFIFNSDAPGFPLDGIQWQGQELLHGGGGSLWEITLGDAAGNRAQLSPAQAKASQGKISRLPGGKGQRLVIRWVAEAPDGGDVEVRVTATLPRASGLARWRIQVRSQSKGYGLRHVVFPRFDTLEGQGREVAIPAGLGLIVENPLTHPPVRIPYPGNMMTPFMALTGPKASLYLGTHDPAAHHKQFVFESDSAKSCTCLKIEVDPAGLGHTLRSWQLPFEVTAGAFTGNWYDAACLYRAWTLKSSPWNRGRTRVLRKQIPRKLLDTDFWICESGSAEEVVPRCRKMMDYFGASTAVHWYNWHEIPFDDRYPEYFPTKPGFAEGVAQLRKEGFLVMPYINGRLWDPKTDSWRDRHAEASAARTDDGKHRQEVYGSKVPLVPMCPHTSLWQETVAELVHRLLHECGVSGVYVDQIGIAGAYTCFAADHGHPPGGGNFWWQGYRKLLRRCRRSVRPGQFLTTEEACEPWNDLLDAFLMVNSAQRGFRLEPVYSTVYGGVTIQFGFQYLGTQDAELGLPWRAKMGRNFLWGGQLGWVGAWILDPGVRKEAKFLRNLIRCREKVRPFFNRGRMLRPPEVPDVPILDIPTGETAPKDVPRIPSVLASAWTLGSRLLVALVNFSDKPVRARLSLPRAEYRLRPGLAYRRTRLTPEGSGTLAEVKSDPVLLDERLPARHVRAVILDPAR